MAPTTKERKRGKKSSGHGKNTKKGKKARRREAEQKKKAPRYTAKTADKYELYEYSVQSPEVDVEFLMRVYAEQRDGKVPRHFREDFCGTAAMCAEWVRQNDKFTAEGFDLDPEPLAWGTERHVNPLGKAASRVKLHEADVRAEGDKLADVRVAQNFSYQIFMQRSELLEYFRQAREGLADDGIFVIDLYGGPDALAEMEEEREIEEGFTYVWDQDRYYPGSGEFRCFIHFRFEDGSEMKRAFEYTWRTWQLTELRDVLLEAGFSEVKPYFEGTDEDSDDGDGDGDFQHDEKGEACDAWLAYLVANK